MLRDAKNLLTPTPQTIAATAVTTDSIPLAQAGSQLGDGEPMALVFTLTADALRVGTEAYTFQAVSATNPNGTTGQVQLAASPTFTVAAGAINAGLGPQLLAGDQIVVTIPPGSIPQTATHIAGRVVIASDGEVTLTCDLVPMAVIRGVKAYHGEPEMKGP